MTSCAHEQDSLVGHAVSTYVRVEVPRKLEWPCNLLLCTLNVAASIEVTLSKCNQGVVAVATALLSRQHLCHCKAMLR
jgi:hypothetical protein